MRICVITLLATILLVVLAGLAFIYSGAFNVAATDPHWRATEWVLDKARMRSIQMHATGIDVPKGYDDDAKIVGAIGHFSEHCAICHGGPGLKRGEIGEGMYPKPPDLTNAAARYTPGELFWILKNGIKMSGMPSMASDGDDMLWRTVALLQKLQSLSLDDFNDLWMRAQAQGEHGGMQHGDSSDAPTVAPGPTPSDK